MILALLLTLALDQAPQETGAALERDLRTRPATATGQLSLAQLYDHEELRVPAFLAYLRFLSLEQDGKRAAGAAARVREILNAAAVAPQSGTDEREMMLAIAASSVKLPENRKANEFERFQNQVTVALAMLAEAPQGSDFTAEVNLPFFVELSKRELTDAFVAIAFSSLKLKGGDVWMSHHPADISKAQEYMRSQLR